MKKSEVHPGRIYVARVSGRLVNVRLDAIREEFTARHPNGRDVYDVTNLLTGRRLVFHSAAKFRWEVKTRSVDLEERAEAGILRASDAKELERLRTPRLPWYVA